MRRCAKGGAKDKEPTYVDEHLVQLLETAVLCLRENQNRDDEDHNREGAEDKAQLRAEVRVRRTQEVRDGADDCKAEHPADTQGHADGLASEPVGGHFAQYNWPKGAPCGRVAEAEDANEGRQAPSCRFAIGGCLGNSGEA